MNQSEQRFEDLMDGKALMVFCIHGLLRHAKELDVTQGAEARDKVVEIRNLTQEIVAFWDLGGAIFETPCEIG